DERFAIVPIPKQVLGEVQPRAEKPSWTELGVRGRPAIAADEDPLAGVRILLVSDHAVESPDLAPEQFEISDRPLVERRVVPDSGGARPERLHTRDEPRQVGVRNLLSRRLPQR